MVVTSLKPVDLAVIGHKGDILDIVEEIRPQIIALGPDQKFNKKKMRKELKERGLNTKVIRIKSKLKGSSTTSLMKKSKKIKL